MAVAGVGVAVPLGLAAGEPAPGLAAFLVVAQAGKLCAPRGARDLGLALVVGIVLLGVAAAEGVEPSFGLLLLLAALFTLAAARARTRLALLRETLGEPGSSPLAVGAGPRWLTPAAVLSGGRTGLLVAAGTCLVFFAFPRVGAKLLPARRQSTERLSGFTDEVGLEDIGRIKRSDQLAFRCELPPGVVLDPDGPYWRGTALDTYDGTTWRRAEVLRLNWTFEGVGAGQFQDRRLARPAGDPIEATMYQEPIGSRYLFGPGAVEEVTFKTAGPRAIHRDYHGGMSVLQPAAVALAYRVRCWPGAISELRLPPRALEMRRKACLELPERVDRAGLRAHALELLRRRGLGLDAPPSRKARVLTEHLAGSYSYTVEGTPPTGREPVEEFLFHRKTGHCEVFASALAVLLRAIDVPARLVTGYRGGDQNQWSGTWTVRQREAHAWVEAWTEAGWQRFDATPAAQANPGAFGETMLALGDWLELRWFQYVIAFDAYDQRNFLFWLEQSLPGLAGVAATSVGAGALLGGALLLSALALALLVRRLRRRRGAPASRDADSPGLRRLLLALRRHDLHPAPAETLLELARRAEERLGPPAGSLPEVVPDYYAARFGEHPAAGSEARLEALAAALEALPPA